MKAIVVVCVLFLSTAVANASLITYGFVDATADFSFGPVSATADITGTFSLDTSTQIITSVDINLSGLPSFLSDWNSNYPTVGNSFWTSTPAQFIATNASGDQLRLELDHANPAYSWSLYGAELADTQQFGPVFDDSVTGGVNETPLPTALPLFATGLGALGLLGWRRKRNVQAVA